jgi:hypothetical protein
MALTSVFGFFYQVGSLDYPSNISSDAKFGFDSGSTTPVFKYTLNQVKKSFTNTPYEYSRSGFFNSDRLSQLLVDSGALADVQSQDLTTQYWSDTFKILEYLYNNQATFTQGASSSSFNYNNKGDEVLSTVSTTSNVNPYYISEYKTHSLLYELSSHTGRVKYVTFQVTFTSGVITFTVYFDADSFVERSDGIHYSVYRYVDTAPSDGIISQGEFNTRIVALLMNTLSTGEYNSYVPFYTKKRTGDTVYVTEQFFVFSSYADASSITEAIATTQVKSYLMTTYNSDTKYLMYTYPDLFNQTEVTIIPVYEDTVTLAGGTVSAAHSLDIIKLANTLSAFGFNISQSVSGSSTQNGYRPTEIFHLGPGTGFTPANGSRARYVFPLLAVEVNTSQSGITYPITQRFQNYVPIYGSIGSTDADTFHSILLAVMDWLTGLVSSIDTTLVTSYSITTNAADSSHYNRKYVTFLYNQTQWLVYGPTST